MDAGRRSRNLGLVECAIKAASSHNTQPWRFLIEGDRITILPDPTRRCPAVDPDDHHLFASLGCAAENLCVAARATGLEATVRFDHASAGVQVDLAQSARSGDPLYAAIDLRQCSRSLYDGTPLTAGERRLLEIAGTGEGVRLMLLEGSGQLERIADYVAAGNSAQFADPAWRAELQHWIRFNTRSARATGDGLHGPVMGSPDVPDWLGGLFMRFGFSAARQNRKDREQIRSSAAVAVFVSAVDDRRHWVEAGRCYQRFALQAAALDLRTAFINQPVEVTPLRPEFAAFLVAGTGRPDLVVRVGHGPRMPRSLRRPVEEVLAG